MGKRLWLPMASKPYPFGGGEREELMNRLWEAKYLVPGARLMDLGQLRDLTQFAEARNQERLDAEEEKIRLGAAIVSRMPQDQVIGALREFQAWRKKKRQGK